jgi:hypothetical protein
MFNPDTVPYFDTYLRSFNASPKQTSAEVEAVHVRSVAEVELAVAKLGREPRSALIAARIYSSSLRVERSWEQLTITARTKRAPNSDSCPLLAQSRHRRVHCTCPLLTQSGHLKLPARSWKNCFTVHRCGEWIWAKSIATGLPFAAPPNKQTDVADNGERDQKPPSRSIDVVKAPRRNGESRHNQSQVTGYVDRTKSFAS